MFLHWDNAYVFKKKTDGDYVRWVIYFNMARNESRSHLLHTRFLTDEPNFLSVLD